MPRRRIVVVPGRRDVLHAAASDLRAAGHEVAVVAAGHELLARRPRRFDLVLAADEELGADGAGFCAALRSRQPWLRIVVVGPGDPEREALFLGGGADDYLPLPLVGPVVRARVTARLRAWDPPRAAHSFGEVAVDLAADSVTRNGVPVPLAPREMQLLRYLVEHRGQVVTRAELAQAVWGGASPQTRTVDVHVSTLRRKLERTPHMPRHIVTVRGQGYRLG